MARHYQLDPATAATTTDFAAELNDQQLAAVTAAPGPALVIAGAGSGKTRTLTYRVAWLLEQGIAPRNILLLTFTNKAAREMLERVGALSQSAAEGIWGGTFHSIGNRILRRHAERIGFRQGFTIMDREDQEEMVESIVAREGLRTNDRRFPKGEVLADIFSYSINTGAPISQVVATKYRYFMPLIAQIERVQVAYEGRKREANSLDFDDLLSKTLELLQMCEDVATQYQQQFQHILVDEYQDTNRLQAELVDWLGRKHGNIMVVGDDAQSIYSWRGANFANILDFPKRYPTAQVFKIETNYRSVPEVLKVANASILANERQFPKNLAPVRTSYPMRPALVPLATNNQQATFLAQRILELHEEGVRLNEIAVLYRAHYHSMEVQLELTRRGIPFSITSGLRFFEQAHVKDVSAFLKFATNPRDEVAFKRMVKLLPGVGAKSAESIWSQTSDVLDGGTGFGRLHGLKVPSKSAKSWEQLVHTLAELAPDGSILSPSTMIDSVLFAVYDDYMKSKFANYEARREDLNTLAGFARQFESTEEFLSQLALLGSVETTDALAVESESEKVTLSTIHQAKGLEWKVVFLIWLTEGMFPSSRSAETDEGIEEERRLFYVGVTRCCDELYLTYPDLRLNAGYGEALQRPSRFLTEIPEDLVEGWEVSSSRQPEKVSEEDAPF
ncbi:MAG: DNA helicase UvrD [Verrucomicrobia bacterium 61-8]|nr:ATP-dependent helicase [Verrucomicrobiota bacterium]OJV09498.1 MAG: DNA helicase UvrD [Verrucomicrobia bacterium 61-8]